MDHVKAFLKLAEPLERIFPWLTPLIDRARRGRMSQAQARILCHQLEAELVELERVPIHLLEVPTAEELHADGEPDIELGCVMTAPDVRFGLRSRDRAGGVIITGRIRSGKTNLLSLIALGAEEVVLLFIRKAHELRELAGRMKRQCVLLDMLRDPILDLGGPRSAPMEVANNLFASQFGAATGTIAATTVISGALNWLGPRLNPAASDGGGQRLYPSIRLLRETIERAPSWFGGKVEYAQSALTYLKAIEETSCQFKVARGVYINDYLSKGINVIIDITGIQPVWLRNLLVRVVLDTILCDRNHTGHLCDRTDLWVLLDEGDDQVTRDAQDRFRGQLSPEAQMFQEGRGLGISPVVVTHSPGTACREVLTNARAHFFFNLSDAESIAEAARTLLLPRGSEKILPSLQSGCCIVRETQTSFPEPFLGLVDWLPPNPSAEPVAPTVPDCVPGQSLDELPELAEELAALCPRLKRGRAAAPAKRPKLGPRARQLLDLATLYILAPLYFLWRKFEQEPSGSAQEKARKQLEKLELIECESLRVGRSQIVLLRVTGGWAHLDKEPAGMEGRGSLAHVCCQHWIAGVFRRRGHRAEIEGMVPGTSHPADVLVHLPEGLCDVEVIHGCDANLLSHLTACLLVSRSIARVIVVATEKQELARLQKMVEAEPSLKPVRSRISFETIEAYMRGLYG